MFSVAGTNMLIYHRNFRWIQLLLRISPQKKKCSLIFYFDITSVPFFRYCFWFGCCLARHKKKERKYFSMSEVNFHSLLSYPVLRINTEGSMIYQEINFPFSWIRNNEKRFSSVLPMPTRFWDEDCWWL